MAPGGDISRQFDHSDAIAIRIEHLELEPELLGCYGHEPRDGLPDVRTVLGPGIHERNLNVACRYVPDQEHEGAQ